MGAAIPRVITPSSASGAQVVDGSLVFNGPLNQHLIRTPSSSGNRRTWTVSFWAKLNDIIGYQYFFSAGTSLSNDFMLFQQDNAASTVALYDYTTTMEWYIDPSDMFRDPGGWYHFLVKLDSPNQLVEFYVNNRLVGSPPTNSPSANYQGFWNHNVKHRISDDTYGLGCQLSQFYNIDGKALEPSDFAYTDPLTNTWRPKKFSAFDNPNNEINWSGSSNANWSGDLLSGYSYTDPFEGSWQAGGTISNSSGARVDNSGTHFLTWTNPNSDIIVNKLEILAHRDTSGTVEVNGTDVSSLVNATRIDTVWAEIPGVTSLSTITLRNDGGQAPVFYGARINGYPLIDDAPDNSFYLPMDGSAPIGKDQSGVKHLRYSGVMTSGSGAWYGGTFTPDNAFDGTPESGTYCEATSDTITWNPVGLSWGASLEVMCASASMTAALDGGASVSLTADSWTTVTTGAGSIKTSLIISRSGSANAGIKGIRIDGVILADGAGPGWGNDWTPVNFGGSAALDKATGALPILNTVNGGKGALGGVRKDYSPYTPNIVKESGCVYFDGAYDCIYTPDSSDFSVGSGDFTLELWFYRTRSGGDDWMAIQTDGTSANSGVGLHVWSTTYGGSDANKIHGRVRIGSSNINCTGTTVIGTSSWHHAAFVRDGTNLRIYLDGVQEGVTAVSTDAINDPSAPFIVGAVTALGEAGIEGYLSNVRYVVGTCLYPSGTTFTPSAAPLTNVTNTKLLCCQSSTDATAYAVSPAAFTKVGGTFASHSAVSGKCVLALPLVGNDNDVSNDINSGISTAQTVTTTNAGASDAASNFYGNSYYFDGTGDYITVTDSSEITLGSGDFTIEYWQNLSSVSGNPTPFDKGYSGSGIDANGWIIQYSSSKLLFYVGSSAVLTDPDTTPTGEWIHWAFVRSSGTLKMYRDGIEKVSASNSTDLSHSTNLGIGANLEAGSGFGALAGAINGYLSDIRIYKGAAKYTSDFIPASTNPDILPDTPSGVALSSNLTKVTDGSVYFDGTGDYLSLPDSADFHLSDNDFTLECFIYQNAAADSNGNGIHGQWNVGGGPSDNGYLLWVDTNQKFGYYDSSDGTNGTIDLQSDANAISLNRWHHVAATRSDNTFRIFVDGVQVGSTTGSHAVNNATTTYKIGAWSSSSSHFPGYISDVRLVNGTALYTQNFTPPTAQLTNVTNTKLLCCQSPTSPSDAAVGGYVSAWLPSGFTYWSDGMDANWNESGSKTSSSADYINVALPTSGKYYWESTLDNPSEYREIGIQQGADYNASYDGKYFGFYFNQTDKEALFLTKNEDNTSRDGAVTNGATVSGGGFSNGEKIMWAWDADNDKVWLGRDGTWFASGDPATGANASIIGEDLSANTWYFKIGYNNEAGATNTLALTNVPASDSGSTPVPTVNGDAAAITSNPFNTDINTVRGQGSGYATFNPLSPWLDTGTLSDGNLKITTTSGGNSRAVSTIRPTSGKWYCEFEVIDSTRFSIGVENTTTQTSAQGGGSTNSVIVFYNADAYYNSTTFSDYLDASISSGDLMSVCLDLDNVGVWIARNNGWGGNATLEEIVRGNVTNSLTSFVSSILPLTGDVGIFVEDNSGTGSMSAIANFGQKPFKYVPPEGFQPLNAANLQSPGVVRPDSVVGVTTWKGNSTYPRNITGFNFKPDLLWPKNYSTDLWGWPVWDSVRGAGWTKSLRLDTDDVQNAGIAPYCNLSAIISDGFTLDTTTSSPDILNSTGDGVAFCWKAGGNPGISTTAIWTDEVEYASAAAAGLDGGTITPTGASVGTPQGFSIIKYRGNGVSGATLSHGLSQAPDFFIIKSTIYQYNWNVYHQAMGNTHLIRLNTTAVKVTESGAAWNDTSPTSSVITFGNLGGTNMNTAEYMAYIWHDVPGLQKFGQWTNNNSNDGVFVELGFRPAILLLKCTDATEEWYIINDNRYPNNLGPGSSTLVALQPSSVNNEADTVAMAVNAGVDFLSNGFKIRSTDTSAGEISFGTRNYIYAAWAHQPMNNLFGGQSNAR